MKRYEKMSKEEILSVLESASSCSSCRAGKDFCIKNRIKNGTYIGCSAIVSNWLNEEIKPKKVHRYELIKSPEDVDNIEKEFTDFCQDRQCSGCRYIDMKDLISHHSCFLKYLKEEIEIEV